jgi:hypothetical protein
MSYSEKVLDHFNNPRNMGSLPKERPDVGTRMVGAPECGDVMKLQNVGVHKGTPNDGYVCSSKPMLEEYTKRPTDFSREIIARGTYPEMFVFEQSILKAVKANKDSMFYNQALSTGPFYSHGPMSDENKKNME